MHMVVRVTMCILTSSVLSINFMCLQWDLGYTYKHFLFHQQCTGTCSIDINDTCTCMGGDRLVTVGQHKSIWVRSTRRRGRCTGILWNAAQIQPAPQTASDSMAST